MKYILGVDGGGTKTEAIAYDLKGNIISKGVSKFGNLLVNNEKALENIREAIDNCTKELNIKECIHIYLGIAGVSAGDNKQKVMKYIIESFHCETTVVNDAELALSALLKGKDGFLTISGTGSICIGKYNNEKVRVGGWGHILGDEGSGYYIALEALKKIIFEKDMGYTKSNFTKMILDNLEVSDEFDIINFVYNSDKGKISAIVPVIVELSKNNDSTAIDILKQSGRELGIMTARAINRMKINETVNIGISGSILTNINLVKESFVNVLHKEVKDFRIYDECASPTIGAYYEVIKYINS
ncbi:BadF-type ATPase [Clostridium cavendishii DSM 21758]|uniref:BadF-type ATPase n=1 Tax=Clostridium cavendishii DSM 21758 TaxID=1121302 RepID=A0A1M6UPG9_9CLOT|nr:BadF/BadG/BcrA/BcrD ATPase family protein [Clostridium cavendishii]SHK71049.1 BadF-type ATPase [Clostridium cavendishii DSM 21758]